MSKDDTTNESIRDLEPGAAGVAEVKGGASFATISPKLSLRRLSVRSLSIKPAIGGISELATGVSGGCSYSCNC